MERRIKKKKRLELKFTLLSLGIVIISLFALFGVSATPSGVSDLNITSNETGSNTSSGNLVNISGGYIATLN